MIKKDYFYSDIKNFFLGFIVFFFSILFFLFIRGNDEYETYATGTGFIIEENIFEENFDNIEAPIGEKDIYHNIINNFQSQIKTSQSKITKIENIQISFIPPTLENDKKNIQKRHTVEKIISSKIFSKHDLHFSLEYYKTMGKKRAVYFKNTIKIFNIQNISDEEFVSIFLHELAHYLDIEYLQKQVFFDISENFYAISWKETKVLFAGSQKDDFVSGYAMTNKYEDFAESFLYYMLFNNDFKNKSLTNKNLSQKYHFFSTYIFKNNEFQNTNFKIKNQDDFYWDITKIPFSLKNFLEYLEK